MKQQNLAVLYVAVIALLAPNFSDAVVPTMQLNVKGESGAVQPSLLLSEALFGRIPSMESSKEPWLTLRNAPETNPLMCDDTSKDSDQLPANTMLLVPRGTCSFELKTLHAERLGASGVLIYETLASHYSLNTTSGDDTTTPTISDIIFPHDKNDYDCSYGEIDVPYDSIVLDNPFPYNPTVNDPVLAVPTPTTCESQYYFLTNLSNNEKTYKACCAWDLSMDLAYDSTLVNETVNIPAAFLTLRQHAQLTRSGVVTAQLSRRWYPSWNASAGLIWALGVAVAAWAAWNSASDYHHKKRKLLRPRTPRTEPRAPRPVLPPPPPEEETLDLTPAHVAGFIVSASTSLLVLFYFKIYGVVKVFYAFGCSTALAQVVLYPLSARAIKRDFVLFKGDAPLLQMLEVGDVTLRDALSHAVAFTVGGVWLMLAFWAREPDRILFFWVLQDVFGSCMCCIFLKVIRLNNLKVAALLLVVAFFYDIFFVFITPHLFHGKSVMITVATSGGPPTLPPLWCEKYPNDAGCQGGNPLPMLLTIPRLFDYRGGSSLLGLGDIVLPGLLLSFAARLDAAKELIGLRNGGRGRQGQSYNDPCPNESNCCNGYFTPLVIAYAIGLAMANAAVYLMHMGQPALLYLVPCCLGTMSWIGFRKQELHQLWEGPVWLEENATSADENRHAPLPSTEQDEAMEAPSATDTEG